MRSGTSPHGPKEAGYTIAMLKEYKESVKLKGEVKIVTTKAPPAWVRSLGEAFEEFYFSIIPRTVLRETAWMSNIVLASSERGIYLFLDRMAGITTYSGVITHADIGKDNTAATSADTGLGDPILRAQTGLANRTTNQASFRFFFSDALLPDDTYNEIMMFTDGTATLGTGRPFNRIVFDDPLVKATGEDNSILVRVTGTVE